MHGRRIATMRGLRHLLVAIATTVLSMTAMPEALAAPCAGFTDVDDTSGFCPNVEWLKNRAITLGCTSTTVVLPERTGQPARDGRLHEPARYRTDAVQLRVDIAPGAIDLDANAVVCQTSDFAVPVGSFPRRAYVDLSFNGNATADVGLAADLVVSTDAGANWTPLNTVTNRGSVAANQWGGLSDIGYVDLSVGQTARWGVRMTRGGIAGSTDLADSRCQLRALVYSRDGIASPF